MRAHQRRTGALLSLILLVVNAALSVFYVPIVLKFLTVSEYGIFELGGTIIIFMSMMDLGLSAALSRFYVYYESALPRRVPDLVVTSLLIYVGITLISMVLTGVLWLSLDNLFGAEFTQYELQLTSDIIMLLMVNVLFAIPTSWFIGLITAREQFIFLRSSALIRAVLQFGIVTLVLFLSSNPVLAIAVQVGMSGISFIVFGWFALMVDGPKLRSGRWQTSDARSLLGFSGLLAVNIVFDLIFWRSGQLILGMVSGAGAIASYAIVTRIITSVFMPLSTSISSVYLPKLTQINLSRDSEGELNSLFVQIGRIQAALVWTLIGAFCVLGSEFVQLWIGGEFSGVYSCVLVLMIGLSISAVQSLGPSILQAKNQLGFRSMVLAGMLLVFLVASGPIAATFGDLGLAVVGALIIFFGTGPVMNLYYHFRIGLNIPVFFRATLPAILPVAISAGLVALGRSLFLAEPSWINLVISAIVFIGLNATLMWTMYFNASEKQLLSRPFKKDIDA